jgi:putative membrane protein
VVGPGGMMGSGWGGFGIGLMMLFPLLFLGGFIALIVWAVTQISSGGHAASGRHAADSAGDHQQSAEEILQQRFAKGEIDAEEYEERLRILRGESPAAHRKRWLRLLWEGRSNKMLGASSSTVKGYTLAAAAGAVAGGLGVALATKAIPKIMDRMAEHWRQMMAGFGEAQRNETQSE